MLFDIIIPTFNNKNDLKTCLQGLAQQTISDFKVWICVDGSTDGTLEWLGEDTFPFPLSILTHPHGKNEGRAATRNLPLPYLSATYICLLDSDLIPNRTFLEQHLAVVKKGDVISLGKVNYLDSDNPWTAYSSSRGKTKYNHLQKIGFQYLESGNVCMPTAYFKAVHGFDAAMKGYGGEDNILGYRIHRQFPSVSTIANHKAIVSGVLEKSLQEGLAQREKFAAEGLHFIEKEYPEFNKIFHFSFLKSNWAAAIYGLSIRFRIDHALLQRLPKMNQKNQLRAIHWLVFLHLYKGYYGK